MIQGPPTAPQASSSPNFNSILQAKSLGQLEQEDADAATKEFNATKALNATTQTELASFIQKCWQAARLARETITNRMLECLRQRNGVYDAETIHAIQQQGGSDIFMMLTEEKCTACESWLEDILFTGDEKPWDIRPTPIPDLDEDEDAAIRSRLKNETVMLIQTGMIATPEEVKARYDELQRLYQEAQQDEAVIISARMERKMDDQFTEGGFYQALRDTIPDVVTYPAGFVKGPILRKRPKLTWKRKMGAAPVAVLQDEIVLEWERKSPFDIYPSPSCTDIGDGYLLDINYLTKADLYALIGVKGYNEEAIREVLQAGEQSIMHWLWPENTEKQRLEDRPHEWMDTTGKIVALQFWGHVQGSILQNWGMPKKDVPDPEKQYAIEAWQIGPWTIRARLNGNPGERIPYYKASFRKKPGSFWGFGVPETMRDCQNMCNATARSVANNLAICSGPQVAVDISQIAQTENITKLYPWKIWQFNGQNHTGQPPISFFQPSANVAELMQVYQNFSEEADTKSGIPKYMYGSQGGGAGVLNTASGLSMMMNNASKGIKRVMSNIDNGVIEPATEALYLWNMLNLEDESLKGDLQTVARGSSSMVVREQQQMRRAELLGQLNNPIDLNIMGPDGRAALIRENLKSLDIPVDDIVPSAEDIARKKKAAALMQAATPPGAQSPLGAAGLPMAGGAPGPQVAGGPGQPPAGVTPGVNPYNPAVLPSQMAPRSLPPGPGQIGGPGGPAAGAAPSPPIAGVGMAAPGAPQSPGQVPAGPGGAPAPMGPGGPPLGVPAGAPQQGPPGAPMPAVDPAVMVKLEGIKSDHDIAMHKIAASSAIENRKLDADIAFRKADLELKSRQTQAELRLKGLAVGHDHAKNFLDHTLGQEALALKAATERHKMTTATASAGSASAQPEE